MKKRFKLIGCLKGEIPVVIGYSNDISIIKNLYDEYRSVFQSEIALFISEGNWIEPISEEKKKAIGNLLACLFGPIINLGSQLSQMASNKK